MNKAEDKGRGRVDWTMHLLPLQVSNIPYGQKLLGLVAQKKTLILTKKRTKNDSRSYFEFFTENNGFPLVPDNPNISAHIRLVILNISCLHSWPYILAWY